jgi:hypothetical protein
MADTRKKEEEETNSEIMDVHFVILFDDSEQDVECERFLIILLAQKKRRTQERQTSGLGYPVAFKNAFFVSPFSNPDGFMVAC